MVQSSLSAIVDGGDVGNNHHGEELLTYLTINFYINLAACILSVLLVILVFVLIFKFKKMLNDADNNNAPLYFPKPIHTPDAGRKTNDIVYRPTTVLSRE